MPRKKLDKFVKPSFKNRNRWIFLLIIVFAAISFLITGGQYYNQAAGYVNNKTNEIIKLPKVNEKPFRLGLDLQGGTHLVYKADVSDIPEGEKSDALEGVRDVVERRVNAFGVSEPTIQVNRTASGEYRLIAELAGVKDVDEAIKMIGETPLLEFKEMKGDVETQPQNIELTPATSATKTTSTPESSEMISTSTQATTSPATTTVNLGEVQNNQPEPEWEDTKLSGKYLEKATVQFDPNTNQPQVSLEFNKEGSKLFEEITARNVGQPVAVFLDGYLISAPVVNEKIPNGQAVINGNFDLEEARLLAQRLNAGALPVPINLISQKTVGASLGEQSINSSLKAGMIGLLLVVIFMFLLYRLPGVMAILSLGIYGLTVLAFFKALPVWVALITIILLIGLLIWTFNELKVFDGILSVLVIVIGILLFVYSLKAVTLTLAGIAGFILSIGMAVDANVLIFERIKEELRKKKDISLAIEEGFKRAWPSIRDGNISTIFICFVLMAFGTGSVKGFGTTLFIGISVSMFSAIVITRNFLTVLKNKKLANKKWLLGLNKLKNS